MRQRLLQWIVKTALDTPTRVLAVATLFGLVALALIPGLEVDASHTAMMDPQSDHMVRAKEFEETFGSPNQVLVVAEGGSEDLRRQFIDTIEERLVAPPDVEAVACAPDAGPRAPGCVRYVLGRVDLEAFEEFGLLYLDEKDVEDLAAALGDEHLGVGALRRTTDVATLLHELGTGLEARAEEGEVGEGDDATRALDDLRALVELLDQRVSGESSQLLRDHLKGSGEDSDSALAGEGLDSAGYLSTRGGAMKLALIRPVHTSDEPRVLVPFVTYVENQTRALALDMAGLCDVASRCPDGPLRVSYTGLPALIADEARSLHKDLLITGGLALLGISLLFGLAFRSLRVLTIGIAPLLLSLAGTLAFCRVVFGSLNLITSAFLATLIGLGIDFSIHLMSRYLEALERDGDHRSAIREAVIQCGPGLLTGGMTSAGAFLALVVNDVPAFAELGVLSGVGLLLSLFGTLIVLPAMIVSERLAWMRPESKVVRDGRVSGLIGRWVTTRPGLVTLAGLLLALALIPAGRDNSYNWNYPDYMPSGLPSVATWQRLSQDSEFSTEVAALTAQSSEEAEAFSRALAELDTVRRVESIPLFLPRDQPTKLATLMPLASALEGEVVPQRLQASAGAATLKETLEDLHYEAKSADSEQLPALARLLAATKTLEGRLANADRAISERTAALDREIKSLRDDALTGLRRVTSGRAVTAEEVASKLPPEMSRRLRSGSRYAVYAYPAHAMSEEAHVVAFLEDLKSVDPAPVGFAVEHWHNMTSTIEGFEEAFLLALLAVCLLVFADFRALIPSLASLAPLAVAITWVWGGMALLGIKYNPGNIIAFPLVIGIGVDAGVHIIHRWEQEGRGRIIEVIRHTGFAVFMSTATTLIGFGALALASNRALASLGVVLLLGVSACLVTATILLPAWLTSLRPKA